MGIKKLGFMLFGAFSLAALLNGCGSDSKGGPSGEAGVLSGGVAYVGAGQTLANGQPYQYGTSSSCMAQTCHGGQTSLDLTAAQKSTAKSAANVSTSVPLKTISAEFATSLHNPDASGTNHSPGCQGCHGGGGNHNGVGAIPFPNPLNQGGGNATSQCIVCHSPGSPYSPDHQGGDLTNLFTKATGYSFAKNCGYCHASVIQKDDSGNPTGITIGGVHSIGTGSKDKGCVDCHAIDAPYHGDSTKTTLVKNDDNVAVRAVVSEFGKWSHHIVNADGSPARNEQCAACHLEGQLDGKGTVDSAVHMNDTKIHLRNGNTSLTDNQTKAVANSKAAGGKGASEYPWDPASPDYTLMDQFCFSCHNSGGAPQAVGAVSGNSAVNPFKDSISNQYDQLSRGAVVAVYDQFDTGNTSHHAVRGVRYTAKTLPQSGATFTAISSANVGHAEDGTAESSIHETYKTIYDAGKFTAQYVAGTTTSMADNSQIHCADCHTVGQFKPGVTKVVNLDGTLGDAVSTVIGAHGSDNEYMLRKADGSESHSTVFTVGSANYTNKYQDPKDKLVCYLCHNANYYSNATGAAGGHDDIAGTNNNVHCNDDTNNGAGQVGRNARLYTKTSILPGTVTFATYSGQVVGGTFGAGGGGNIFGIKCLNCHNASDDKNFGGIHGNYNVRTKTLNATYTSYSATAAGSAATTVPGTYRTVTRLPYRFLPGLGNFRYNGGNSKAAWSQQSLKTNVSQGCYTLNGLSTLDSPTKATTARTNVNAASLKDDTGILGSWGACTEHAGSVTKGVTLGTNGNAEAAPARNFVRPLTY